MEQIKQFIEEGEEELRILLVKLDDAIHFREKVITTEDRVQALETIAQLKKDILNWHKSRQTQLIQKIIEMVEGEKLPTYSKSGLIMPVKSHNEALSTITSKLSELIKE